MKPGLLIKQRNLLHTYHDEAFNVNVYEIEIKFSVGNRTLTLDNIDDYLYERGFGDAFVSHGGGGLVSISLSRQAVSERELISSTKKLIEEIFPNATWLSKLDK